MFTTAAACMKTRSSGDASLSFELASGMDKRTSGYISSWTAYNRRGGPQGVRRVL